MYVSKDNVSLQFNLILEMTFGELTCIKRFCLLHSVFLQIVALHQFSLDMTHNM